MKFWQKILYLGISFVICLPAFAIDRDGRLGIGFSNQLENSVPSVSFKMHRSRAFALGGLLALNTDDNDGGYGAGIKLYRNFFDEPQLQFYGALLGAVINKKTSSTEDHTGFQIDLTLGAEFSFTGLESLGFSFEVGVSFNKLEKFVVETVGDSFAVAGIHFYL